MGRRMWPLASLLICHADGEIHVAYRMTTHSFVGEVITPGKVIHRLGPSRVWHAGTPHAALFRRQRARFSVGVRLLTVP